MKTAEEWVKERATTKGVLGNLTVNIARSIQSDALREAAEIVEKRISFVEAGEPAQINNQADRRAIMEAILDKAKELELHR